MMILAFMLIPMLFAVGFGLDYGRAMRAQSKLSAIADSAALLTVSPAMMAQTDAAAAAAARAYFNAQAAGLAGVTVSNLDISSVTTNNGALAGTRVTTLSYRATSANLFSTILGSASLPISGSAKVDASTPPSMNFYVALDTSPSMLLPTTTTGLNQMLAGAIWKGEAYWWGVTDGCAFACHANNNQQWNVGVYVIDNNNNAIYLNNTGSGSAFFRVSCSGNVYDTSNTQIGSSATLKDSSGNSTATYCSGYGPRANPLTLRYKKNGESSYTSISVNFPDTWWLAQNNSQVNPGQSDIMLRTDAEASAAAGLISYAYSFQQTYASAPVPPTYKLQFLTFNINAPAAVSTSPFGTMTPVSTLYGQTFPDLGAQAPLMCANTTWTSCSQVTNNADTGFATMLAGMQAIMPTTAGTGTATSPQNVLIIITDGAEDSSDGLGAMSDAAIAKCNAIKANDKARIAILYTEYRADTINYTANSYFNDFASYQIPNILPKLQSCASRNPDGTYLIQTVSTDGDLSAALNKLFAMTVRTARIVR